MPSVATSPAIASGVSAAKVVATIEVPASHHGRVRPAAKKDSVFSDARRACHAPQPKARMRYATMMLISRVVSGVSGYSLSAHSSRRSMVSAYSITSSSITVRTDFVWFIEPTIWPTK